MVGRGITVRRQEQSRVFVPNRGEAFRLVVIAEDAVGMPAEVFAFQKTLVDPYESTTGDEFIFICSPFDLSIYPANEPDLTQWPSFFRKSAIDILLPTQAAAEDAWLAIKEEVAGLVTALNKLDVLRDAETYRVGDPVEDTSLSESVS